MTKPVGSGTRTFIAHSRRLAAWCLVLLSSLVIRHSTLGAADLSPAAELASFRVLDGFEVSLFASETNGVVKPIQIRFDADGRLWVAGSASYPQIRPGEVPNDQVVVLEDTDHDGRADKSTVFADGLLIPSGLELGDGGLYVGSGTELLHLRDRDGDGRADERRVVFRGFGTGDTHQTINSFTWGPSGELLFSQGLHAHSRIETPWGIEELRQAGVWRFWPRQLRLDAFWDGAMGAHNPFGNVFDRWGQPFVFAGNGHGIYQLTPAMIRTDHFLEQGSLWNQGRKFGGGDFVENSHWPAANQGEAITGGYLQNTVERFRIVDDGASFKVTRLAPLIESTNLAFRIVDARFGPDGALYLCDWLNPVIGHYQASFRHPDRDRAHGRIWRVTAKGRPLVPWKPLKARPTAELLEQLKSPERWNRQLAKRVLADRPTPEVTAALASWLAAGGLDEHALVEALGVFASHEVVETNLLARLARSPRFEARAYAAQVAGHWADRLTAPLEFLAPLASDPHPRVRLEAIVACSYVPEARAVEVAARATDLPLEPALEYAFTQCVHALKPFWRDAYARGELRFDGRPARLTAFARADGGANSAQFAAGRLRRLGEVALDESTINQLAEAVAENGGTNELTVLLSPRSFTLGTNYLATAHSLALFRAAESSRRRGLSLGESAAAGLKPLLASPDPSVQAIAAWLAGVWRVPSVRSTVEALAQAEPPTPLRRGSAPRAYALSGVAGFADPAARELLTRIARSSTDPFAQADAIAALTSFDLTAAASLAAEFLALPHDPDPVAAVFNAFLRRQGGPDALLTALSARPPAAGVASVALPLVAGSGRQNPQLSQLTALLVRAAGTSAPSTTVTLADIPELVRGVREAGDATRGAEVFRSPNLACATCHSVDGTPGKIGPNLSALGTAQTPEFILGAILDPQKEVKEGFMAHEIIAADGTTYQGYLRGETPEAVTIFDHLTGESVRLPVSRIASRRQLGSLMPAGLVDSLTREELRDLVKYLGELGRR